MKSTKCILSVGTTCLLGMFACLYLIAIVYINFSVTPGFYITDMYTDVMVAVEMWEEKTLFPQSWIFGNQLYVMATPVVASLIYGITGNAFKSMGAASCVMAVLVIASFDWMMKPVFKKAGIRLFAIVTFLAIVVLYGDAVLVMNGWQLLFTMCSYYACYAVSVFLSFGCYIRSTRKIPWVMTVVSCVMAFAMGIQSLRQTAVMVLPLIGLECLHFLGNRLQKKPLLTKTTVTAAVIAGSNLGGLIAGKFVKVNQISIFGELRLAGPADAAASVWDSVKNIWALFARDTTQSNGILQVALLVIFVMALLLYLMRTKSEAQEMNMLIGLLVLSVLAIFAVDVLTTMNVRSIYYFMLYPLVSCLMAWTFGFGWHKRELAMKIIMTALLSTVFCMSCVREVIPACRQAYDRKLDRSYEISEYLLDNGYSTIYSSWNFCEKLAVASFGKLEAGFWTSDNDPFIPVAYLHNDEIYNADGSKAAYLFRGAGNVQFGVEKARNHGIELTLVAEYPDEDIYIYTANVNLMQVFQ